MCFLDGFGTLAVKESRKYVVFFLLLLLENIEKTEDIYLTALGLSCSTWDIHYVMWDLSLGHVGSVVVAHVGLAALSHEGSQFPDQGSNPYPLQSLALQDGFLTTGPPGKPLVCLFLV